MNYRAKIDVTLKKSILDPQGKTVKSALHSMDFRAVQDVRVGKFCDITVEASSQEEAEKMIHDMCDKLLVNPVIEEYTFTTEEI